MLHVYKFKELIMSNNNENDNIIKPIKSIFKINYNIPEYQRGYKWGKEQVLKLLEDIDSFDTDENNNEDKFYCLQNITIVKKNDYYDVIDGQQRLTTLFIVLSYLQKYYRYEEVQLKNRLKYSIRKYSEDFLYNYIFENNVNYIEEKDSKYFYNENFNSLKNFDSQDVFHFALAKYTIIEFFKDKTDEERTKFIKKLLENVILIVNEVKSGNEENIFRNLNSNKVLLAEQDFIRAIFITRCKEDNKTQKITEKRLRIGYDIDNMNIWWSKSSIYKYFKRFSKSYKGDNSISLLYNIFFQCFKSKFNKNNNKEYESLFDYLDNNNEKVNDTLKEVLRFHNTMVDWYKNYDIYHLIGFISATKQNNIANIWNKWEENISRDAFIKKLKNMVKLDLDIRNNLEKYTNIQTICYKNNEIPLIKLLVLIDIIKILKNNEKNFVRLPVEYFSGHNEDIEHIFSKTPNKETTIKEAKENIENIIKLIKDNKITNELNNFKNRITEYSDTDNLNEIGILEEYKQLISSIPIINSIGNLVLLNLNVNRGYGNSEYEIKRNTVVFLYEESNKYVRNHTWTIFTKSFYSNDKKDLNNWTIKDIEATAKYIRDSIENFFKEN